MNRNEFSRFLMQESYITYAALSNSRSEAPHAATRSATSQSRSVTPAAIAGVVRSVPWILMKLYAK